MTKNKKTKDGKCKKCGYTKIELHNNECPMCKSCPTCKETIKECMCKEGE